MLFSIEQAFVGRDEKRTLLKTPAWEAIPPCTLIDHFYIQITFGTLVVIPLFEELLFTIHSEN